MASECITIGRKHGTGAVLVLGCSPEQSVVAQRRSYYDSRASKMHPEFAIVELWQEGQPVLRTRFDKPVEKPLKKSAGKD